MVSLDFGTLDLIGSQLDKHKDRLGPLHRPLYILSGAAVFLLLVALLIGLPVLFFDSAAYIAFSQISMVVVYFVLLLAIKQNVYDRFVFCTILFIVVSAAPVVVASESAYSLIDFGAAEAPKFPVSAAFGFGLMRGLLNAVWAVPFLFYFHTFAPTFKAEGEAKMIRASRASCLIALIVHGMAAAVLIWQHGVFQRFTASTEGADRFIAEKIAIHQRGFLVFMLLYLAMGLAAIAVVRFWARTKSSHALITTVFGLLAVQVLYGLATYNVRQLNLRYPAALTTGGTISAFESQSTGQVVFIHGSYSRLGKWTQTDFRICHECRNDQSGKFSVVAIPAAEFAAEYQEIDIGKLRYNQPRKLFCQQTE